MSKAREIADLGDTLSVDPSAPSGSISIDSNGNLDLTGKGIVFGTVSGDVTSKTLDDYEEGTWTPNFGGTRTIASGTTNFTYTKVGRLVTLNFYAINATWTGSTTSNVMTGLPFTASSNTRDTGAVVTRFVNFTDDMVSFCVTTEAASTSLFFPQMRDNLGWVTLNMAQLTTADYLHFTITYTAA